MTRSKKSFKNVKVALLFFIINLVIQIVYRKIFLDYLGSEILGLNTTAMNLLQFLNLAELGVGAAISYSLYKPIAINDQLQINEILSVQGYLYSRIGKVVLVAGVILMLFFPLIFTEIKVPLWYTYATFIVLFLAALIGYFINYQQIILISDQKEYKLNYVIQGVKIVKVLLQLISILLLSNGYVWWLIWELIAIGVTVGGIKYILRIEYPWLVTNIKSGKFLIKKHPEIALKTKQIVAHKLAGFALNESNQLIIFAFTSLSFIGLYGNYLLVIAGVSGLLGAVLNSSNAGVGNLVSECDGEKVINIFEELFTLRFYLAVVACYSIYKFTPTFIIYWVGKNYLLENSSLFILVFIMFINVSRVTVDSFINAYGLFKDIGAPIIELIINILFSTLLGFKYGFNGVLIGVLLSTSLAVLFWKPYFLFKNGFKFKLIIYIKIYAKLFWISLFSITINEFLIKNINLNIGTSFFQFVIYCTSILFIFSILLLVGFILFTKGMRLLLLRIKLHLNN